MAIGLNDVGMFVPSVSNPRKQRRVVKNKFSITDIFIAIPLVILWLVLVLTVNGAGVWWIVIISGIGTIGLIGLLIWPLNYLGKEKLYIYIIRWIAYMIGVKYYRSEKWKDDNKVSEAQKQPLEVNSTKNKVSTRVDQKTMKSDTNKRK